MGDFKQVYTKGGYPLLEAASALQKTIRRGLEVEAMFWAVEIEEGQPNYVWYRLVTIANEDIGIASPMVIMLVNSLKDQYMWLKQQSQQPNERLCIANAVMAMCRAKKTRLADDLQGIVYLKREYESWKLEVPDYALDKHTARGRQKGRGVEHWYEEGCQLNPPDEINCYAKGAKDHRVKYPKEPGRKSPGGKGGTFPTVHRTRNPDAQLVMVPKQDEFDEDGRDGE